MQFDTEAANDVTTYLPRPGTLATAPEPDQLSDGRMASFRTTGADGISRPAPRGWPLQRILFLMAGTVTLTGVILGVTVTTWFLLLPAIAGANQLLMVAVGWCPMSLLLTRLGIGRA